MKCKESFVVSFVGQRQIRKDIEGEVSESLRGIPAGRLQIMRNFSLLGINGYLGARRNKRRKVARAEKPLAN